MEFPQAETGWGQEKGPKGCCFWKPRTSFRRVSGSINSGCASMCFDQPRLGRPRQKYQFSSTNLVHGPPFGIPGAAGIPVLVRQERLLLTE